MKYFFDEQVFEMKFRQMANAVKRRRVGNDGRVAVHSVIRCFRENWERSSASRLELAKPGCLVQLSENIGWVSAVEGYS